MPGPSGLDVLRALRPKFAVPIMMLTARGDDIDRIVGLEMGADDYLAKPFNIRELVARMRAILRRVELSRFGSGTLALGELVLSRESQEARVAGNPIEVTGAEFRIPSRSCRTPERSSHAINLSRRPSVAQGSPGIAPSTRISVTCAASWWARQCKVAILSVRGIGYRMPR